MGSAATPSAYSKRRIYKNREPHWLYIASYQRNCKSCTCILSFVYISTNSVHYRVSVHHGYAQIHIPAMKLSLKTNLTNLAAQWIILQAARIHPFTLLYPFYLTCIFISFIECCFCISSGKNYNGDVFVRVGNGGELMYIWGEWNWAWAFNEYVRRWITSHFKGHWFETRKPMEDN